MRLGIAAETVKEMIREDLGAEARDPYFDPASPDGDPGKFLLSGKPARVIHHWDGYFVKVVGSWFAGQPGRPDISGGPFDWYVFAVPGEQKSKPATYTIVDTDLVRAWVDEFREVFGTAHDNHLPWRCDLQLVEPNELKTAFFRWGDEPLDIMVPSRLLHFRNVRSVVGLQDNVALPKTRPGIKSNVQESVQGTTQATRSAREQIEANLWVNCWICEEVFRRKRETRRYCAKCNRGFCEGEHGNFSHSRGTCVVCGVRKRDLA